MERQVRNQVERGSVLLVTGHQSSLETIIFAEKLGAQAVSLTDLSAAHLLNDPSLIIDVDLRAIETIRKLKKALTSSVGGCRIFLVDMNNRVTSVHANVLGAHQLLRQGATIAEMHAALDEHFGTATVSTQDAVVRESISVGVAALGSSFEAMANKSQLDNAGIMAACAQIANAVCVQGICEWMSAVRTHHDGTFQHCMLVTGVVAAFATKTGMPHQDVVRMTMAGLLHDIGKSNVDVAILDKPGALTLRELDAVRTHPMAGYAYLVHNSTMDAEILSSVLGHHEYLDGSGYPNRLAGADINEMTRIVTTCDVYAALVERRSYKEPKSHAEAMVILKNMVAAGKLDGRLVRDIDWIMAPLTS